MIKNFKDKETEKVFSREFSKKLAQDIQRAALRKLVLLNAATALDELKVPPGNQLEALKGARKGSHCIRVNDQWRICFEWKDGHAHNVEIVDYH